MQKRNRINFNNPYLILTIIITVSCFFIYLGFIFGNKFFMFEDTGSDTSSQYVMWYSSIADKIRLGTFSFWDFKNGFGANIVLEGIYDPFQFIICSFGAIFGSTAIPRILIYINILKILLSGLFMYYFLNCFQISNKVKIIASYMYAFNGFMIVWGQHYAFATIVVYLPLLFASLEQSLYNNRRRVFLVLMTAIIGVYSLYFCYMSLITLSIYLIIRVFSLDEIKHKIKLIVKEIFSILLGLGIACFALLPTAYLILNVSMRTSSDVSVFQRLISSFCFFPKEYYKTFLYRLFSSNLQGTTKYFGYINYYEVLNICCSNLLIFLMFQYVFLLFKRSTPKKEKIIKMTVTILLALACLFPTAGLIYNGFVYSSYRWSFVIIPIFIILSAKTLDKIIVSKNISIAGMICYLLLSSFIYLKAFKRFCILDDVALQLNTVILLLTGFMIALSMYLFVKKKVSSKAFCCFILSIVCINLVADSYISANHRSTITTNSTYVSNVYNKNVNDAINYLKQNDHTFFRLEKTFTSRPYNMMDPLIQNYYGINTYNSVINKYVLNFNEKIWKNIKIGFQYQCFNNAKQDHLKASLVSLKYILTNDKDEQINGFTKINEFGDIAILKNNYDVALGRLYTKSISEKDFEKEQYNVDNILSNVIILEKNSHFNIDSDELASYKSNKNTEQFAKKFQNMPLAQFEIKENDSHLTSFVDTPQDGILLMSVPYEYGWEAYVDGQRTDILKANYGFSAINLNKGSHNIELKFNLPWFKKGIIISAFALLILLILIFYQNKSRRIILSNDKL